MHILAANRLPHACSVHEQIKGHLCAALQDNLQMPSRH